jgi:hypothetical protein
MSETEVVRALWTGTTMDYDAAVEDIARAQIQMDAYPNDCPEYRDALWTLRRARLRLTDAVEVMLPWSISRACHHLRERDAAPRGATQEGEG